jgi:hypothetical protein
MLTLLRANFPHRHNKDENFDSICTRCYATVATVGEEWELSSYESKHICDPVAVHLFSKGSSVRTQGPVRLAPRGSRR